MILLKNYLKRKTIFEGDFGIEIEAEGTPTYMPISESTWQSTVDGSLKDAGAKEYVLKQPLDYDPACAAVIDLYQKIRQVGGSVRDSMRAGVHIHVNCNNMNFKEIFTFVAAYYCLEDCLTANFGEDRIGNLFCLRLTDASYVNGVIKTFFDKKQAIEFFFTNENLRYAALNLNALYKFGSLEFRAMKTPDRPQPILDWLTLLRNLRVNSLVNFKSPAEVLSAFSANGEEAIVKLLLGSKADWVLNQKDYSSTIYENIRNIQYWVYTIDWDALNV